ncbi:MAG TPA: hypothetical protein PLU93_10975 [Treponemataceae bacterium]|nr:hypothetical protein [Treponemataceae bacterium]
MKHLLSTIAFLACVGLAAGRAEAPAATSQPADQSADILSGADVSIRFYDRTVYYPGNSPSEPILVRVTIANNTPNTIRFKLADDHFFSVDFIAMSARNVPLEHTDLYLRKRTTNQHVYFRELSLEPGEEYAFTENVKDYLAIKDPGMYVLEGRFFPELKRRGDLSEPNARTNRLTLEVKPSPGAAAVRVLPVSPSSAEILQPQPIPPDQVVTYLLTARQKSRWEQFYLYLDLEQMLSRDPARSRRFRAESENGRFAMIENYKSELAQAKADKDIATIPVEFQIERTSYTATEGTVTVIEWFDYRTFREKKRFTYYLVSRDGIWRVVDYTVDNLGTE